METIPFSVFSDPEINYFNKKEFITFRYDIGNMASSRIEHYVYCYFVTPTSRDGNTWNVRGTSVGNFPTIYEKKFKISQIEWKFSRAKPSEIDLLLVYVMGNGYFARSEYVLDVNVRREEISAAIKPLLTTAKKFGIPKNGTSIDYIYTEGVKGQKTNNVKPPKDPEKDNYFKILGLVPTSNAGLIKAAYRELAKQYHPDTHIGISQDKMKEINNAYERIMEKLRDKNSYK